MEPTETVDPTTGIVEPVETTETIATYFNFPNDLFYLEISPIFYGLFFGIILLDIIFDMIHWIKGDV